MQAEKSVCTSSVRELEARLLDMQDRLMEKVREVAAAREVQTSLRTEIESYKALIECQEKKYVRAYDLVVMMMMMMMMNASLSLLSAECSALSNIPVLILYVYVHTVVRRYILQSAIDMCAMQRLTDWNYNINCLANSM